MPAVHVMPWPDPVIDTLGHDPRSLYVELFLLPTLGPTTLLLARHLAQRFDDSPDGFDVDVLETSLALGLGPREGANSPVLRALSRLAQFDLARHEQIPAAPGSGAPRPTPTTTAGTANAACAGQADEGIARPHPGEPERPHGDDDSDNDEPARRPAAIWHVRRTFPPVNRRHLRRLPPSLQSALSAWTTVQIVDAARQRARRVAFVLLETGETPDMVERLLLRTGFQPTLAREATEWAAGRHRQAVVAAGAAQPTPSGTHPTPVAPGTRPPVERVTTEPDPPPGGVGPRPAALVPRTPPPPARPAPVAG
jgi:hypothetical protein